AAFVRLGQTRRAVEVLSEASEAAALAHPTVRAEIALQLGIAQMRERHYDEARACFESVPRDADIVHAQATEYRGWTAYASGAYAEAADLFDEALADIRASRHYDRFVEARTLYGLATLVAELPRLELWPELRARIAAFDWSASGLRLPRFWLAIAASFVTEMLGDRAEAERWASEAEDCAPGDAQRIVALCRLAAVLGRYGESAGHAHFVRRARRLYESLKRADALRAERSLPLALAEEIVAGCEPRDAEPLAIYYDEALASLVRQGHESEMLGALRESVEAGLESARGNRAKAARLYARAFARYERIGYGRRGSVVAYRLAELTGEARCHEYAREALHGAADSYWVKAAFARLGAGEMRLGERHAAILRLVASGKTNKEIAAERGISPLTARNAVRELLRRFGASNRTELGRMARERGLA
ncbi:MAG: Bacterial regulatory protein luxR family, partial [Candidatus Eremiobacteraeota bacterium]|nr:Bacterial regulatory protein luxR family [Candidatus Eremiobacteraeota bacterium]